MCCSACQRAERAPGPSRSAATKLLLLKGPDVGALYVCLQAVAVSWPVVSRADELFGVQGMHVLDVATGKDGSVLLEVESDDVLTGCPDCGVVAIGHGRRVQLLHDAPCFRTAGAGAMAQADLAVSQAACARRTWTEVQPYATPRAKLTVKGDVVGGRRVAAHDDTTVSAIARHLGVAWDTC